MRFLHPQLLWFLALLPLLAVLHGRRGPAPALLFSSTSLAATLAGARKARPGSLLLLVRLAVLALLILALARPQQGNTTAEIKASGIDIILAVDVSGSMHGFPLDTAKKMMNDLLGNLSPGDVFNVLLFAGDSKVLAPARRAELAVTIRAQCLAWALGWADAAEIDTTGLAIGDVIERVLALVEERREG